MIRFLRWLFRCRSPMLPAPDERCVHHNDGQRRLIKRTC